MDYWGSEVVEIILANNGVSTMPTPDDEFENDADDVDFDDDESCEPVGSCDECGCDIYEDDIDEDGTLCDQCRWHMSGGISTTE